MQHSFKDAEISDSCIGNRNGINGSLEGSGSVGAVGFIESFKKAVGFWSCYVTT